MKIYAPDIPLKPTVLVSGSLYALLLITFPRKSKAEDTLDFKVLYYAEGNDRMTITSPMIRFETELSPGLTLKVEGIFNTISGATPTGAPPVPETRTVTQVTALPGSSTSTPASTSYNDDDHDEDDDDDDHYSGFAGSAQRLPFAGMTGATPSAPASSTSTSASSSGGGGSEVATETVETGNSTLPTAESEDERIAANLELVKQFENQTWSLLWSYSTESDYESMGVAIKDTLDFNQKNTSLTLGVAYTEDTISTFFNSGTEDRTSVDMMVGVSQVVTPNTLVTVNATLGWVDGYLTDPYKVSEINGQLVIENRPDNKDKQILLVSASQFFPSANGSLESSFRYYNDSFGIDSQTLTLAWYQRLGENWILRPQIRWYDQSAADFYQVRFSGSPEYYSSDYRVSSFSSTGFGLKAVWSPNSRIQVDAEYMRYEMSGNDGVTSDLAYPSADVIILGLRIWL